ncbi:hypothetical protein F4781DRAFT_428135 [Annulohypoxylon bovei var. microspora]|nr:hypothetical protein F4781DRAFT_428135 [Annulohypoxylon bovei var. microspora]
MSNSTSDENTYSRFIALLVGIHFTLSWMKGRIYEIGDVAYVTSESRKGCHKTNFDSQANGELPYDTSREERDLEAVLHTTEYTLMSRLIDDFSERYSNDSDEGQGETSSDPERVGAQINEPSSQQAMAASSQVEQAELSGTLVENVAANAATLSSIADTTQKLQTGLDYYPDVTFDFSINGTENMLDYLLSMDDNAVTEV